MPQEEWLVTPSRLGEGGEGEGFLGALGREQPPFSADMIRHRTQDQTAELQQAPIAVRLAVRDSREAFIGRAEQRIEGFAARQLEALNAIPGEGPEIAMGASE